MVGLQECQLSAVENDSASSLSSFGPKSAPKLPGAHAVMAQKVMVFCAVCFKGIKGFMRLSMKIKEAYPYFSTPKCPSR